MESQAAIPIPTNCQVDVGGANDVSGKSDITSFCVEDGDGAPWEILSLVSIDETDLSISATIDTCALYDTDNDAFADLAACATLHSSGAANGNLTELAEIRLFTCDDSNARECAGSVLIPSPYGSACEVSHPDRDPFSPAIPGGPGNDYPSDTQVLCAIDLDDFPVSSPVRRLLDACAYPSSLPGFSPEDCVLFAECGGPEDCDDGNECSFDDCDPSGVCMHSPDDGASCSDGLFCTGEETCNSLGFCQDNATMLDCDDGWPCTIDVCDELLDACLNDPRDSLCADGDLCNGVESCMPPVAGMPHPRSVRDLDDGCVAGSPPDCDDTVGCTVDSCNASTGACDHVPSDAACDDGATCNGVETCDAAEGCRPGSATNCDDGISCTTDACEEPSGACSHTPDQAACDDGLACNGTEECTPADGCVVGDAPDCDDGVACTTDACDETIGCSHQPDDGACGNGFYCDGIETCDPTGGCQPGQSPCNGPSVCSETTDTCVQCTSNADCDNGLFCDGAETCNTATGICDAGTATACNDSIGCTIDSCDEAANRCAHTPSPTACGNGLFCDGAEICDPATGCRSGAPPVCDDGIACTADACVEATDTCDHTPDDNACDNGRFCDGVETCNASIGCRSGTDVVCPEDGVDCSVERCEEDSRACVADLSGCICGDRDLTFPEECDPPFKAGTFEDCNNQLDDDGDGAVDCADAECQPGNGRGRICDENCKIDLPCQRVERDPASIEFNFRGGPSSLWLHGRFPIDTTPDLMTEGFRIRLSNAIQPIYSASLEAGDLVGKADGRRFRFSDKAAAALGGDSVRDGLARVQIRFRVIDGVSYLSFRVQAYGDFSAATQPGMTTQIFAGAESASLTAQWSAAPKRWYLHQRDF